MNHFQNYVNVAALTCHREKKNQRNHILNIFIPRPNNPYFSLKERIKLLNDYKFSSLSPYMARLVKERQLTIQFSFHTRDN